VRIYEDLRSLQRRAGVAQAVVAVALAALVVYFWHLQVVRGKYFRDLSDNNRIRAVPIPAPRGPLFDRNGKILAENRSSFNIVVTAERKDALGAALDRLGHYVSFDPADVYDRMNERGPLRSAELDELEGEGNREQEREQHLDAGQHDPQLVQELDQLAILTTLLCLGLSVGHDASLVAVTRTPPSVAVNRR